MEHPFGHGFITSIMLIVRHFALPPDQAWFGAGDHVGGLVLPEKFKGTEVEEITILLKKKVIWHQTGHYGQGRCPGCNLHAEPARHCD